MKFAILLFAIALPAVAQENKDNFQAVSSTKFNFNEANIDGKMQAPSGFFLQGRKSQNFSQMVNLRTDFRHELLNSKSAAQSLGQ